MLAVEDFFEEVLGDVEVVVGGFEADTGIAGLDLVELAGELDFGAKNLAHLFAESGGVVGGGGFRLVAEVDEADLVGGGAEMDGGGSGDIELAVEGVLEFWTWFEGDGFALEGGDGGIEAIGDFGELIAENLGRIDLAPAVEVIVREADHGGAVAGGFGPEEIGGSILHGGVVNDAAVVREFTEGGAKGFPGANHGGSEIGAEARGGDVIEGALNGFCDGDSFCGIVRPRRDRDVARGLEIG